MFSQKKSHLPKKNKWRDNNVDDITFSPVFQNLALYHYVPQSMLDI